MFIIQFWKITRAIFWKDVIIIIVEMLISQKIRNFQDGICWKAGAVTMILKMCSTDHLVEEIGKYLQYIK